jgi:hypothetical protein
LAIGCACYAQAAQRQVVAMPDRLNVVVGPKLRADLERVSQQREQTISEITRSAIRKEIRKELPIITRSAAPPRKEEDI